MNNSHFNLISFVYDYVHAASHFQDKFQFNLGLKKFDGHESLATEWPGLKIHES